MNWKKLILLNTILIIIGFFAIIWGTDYMRERQVIQDEQRRLDLYSKILDGASTGPTQMTIDYSKQISTGSPLIFGGAHNPNLEHIEAWDKLEEIGINMIRTDFFMNWYIRNITIQDYIKNINNIQNTDNWNQKFMNEIKQKYIESKKRNIKTMGIIDYTPPWLSHSGTDFGVPKDWNVYKDMVKKTYTFYRNYIDYIEIWNEPTYDHFLDLKNSNLTREEAYKMIFKTAVEAIREVDKEKNDRKRAMVGGPVSHRPVDTTVLEVILQDPQLKKELDFISYHNYEAEHLPEPSDILFRPLLKKYEVNNLPIFITEWNYSPNGRISNPYITTEAGIIYIGNKLLNFLKMNLAGANYYSMEIIKDNQNTDSSLFNLSSFGIYRIKNGKTEFMPQARTWRILSKQMKLGKGESRIFGTQLESRSKNQELRDGESKLMGLVNDMLEPENINSIGFKNIDGEYGTAIVNSSDKSQVIETTLQNTTLKSFTKVRVYYASAGNDAKTPVYEGELKADKNGTIRFPFYIPRETVVGMVFAEDKAWYEQLFD